MGKTTASSVCVKKFSYIFNSQDTKKKKKVEENLVFLHDRKTTTKLIVFFVKEGNNVQKNKFC